MRAKTHVSFAALVISLFDASVPALALSVFSILSDLDLHVKGLIHRTWSHSFVILLPLLFVSGWISHYLWIAVIAMITHPVLDLVNYSPTFLFYPFKVPFRMFKNFALRVGSMGEEVMFWTFTALLIVSLFWMQRGELNKMDLTGGIVFGHDVGFRFAKNIRKEYIYSITKLDENQRKLQKAVSEIKSAREDSVKYSQFPRNPEKVRTAVNKIRSQSARKAVLESRVDSLKVSPTVNGTWIPIG